MISAVSSLSLAASHSRVAASQSCWPLSAARLAMSTAAAAEDAAAGGAPDGGGSMRWAVVYRELQPLRFMGEFGL